MYVCAYSLQWGCLHVFASECVNVCVGYVCMSISEPISVSAYIQKVLCWSVYFLVVFLCISGYVVLYVLVE